MSYLEVLDLEIAELKDLVFEIAELKDLRFEKPEDDPGGRLYLEPVRPLWEDILNLYYNLSHRAI